MKKKELTRVSWIALEQVGGCAVMLR